MAEIRFGKRRIKLPGNRYVRIALGGVFVVLGCAGFLPILGFWMIPVGLLILAVDIPPIRRFNRRAGVWIRRKWEELRGRPTARTRREAARQAMD